MHHELAHTLYSHLAAIAIELPAERSDPDEPLQEDSHSKSDGADSARTADTVEGNHAEEASAATRIAHDTDRDNGYNTSLTFEPMHLLRPSYTATRG